MYGKFIKNTAGYEINTLNLPTSWEYIYENKDILLKVDQFGPVYAQANPPGDIMLFKREQHQKYSPWMVQLVLDETKEQFTNFFRPNRMELSAEPENVKIEYLPECARYSFTYKGLQVATEIYIPNHGITICYKVNVKNLTASAVKLHVRPQLVPYVNDAQMAPWDKYEWYLHTTYQESECALFKSKRLSPGGDASLRRNMFLASRAEGLCGHELSLEKYIGNGDVFAPEQRFTGGEILYGYPPVHALDYQWEIAAGEERELLQVVSMEDEFSKQAYFEKAYYEHELKERREYFEALFAKNHINTGDEEFDHYANYWLPLHMNWVASLDRGWPTGMRGSRDSAQDYAGLLYTEPEKSREIILTMLECQRSDGWFPRQYSAKGKHGKHDMRGHVDAGVFFAELVWKYLAHTGDFAILEEKTEWLDSEKKNTVLEHLIQAVEYYIAPENIGEHGLCKIGEGDWLDAVNCAGLEGRGESVTVSAQEVMALKYLVDILKTVSGENLDENPYAEDIRRYEEAAELLKENLNLHAYNSKGFYNGVFNDDGKWIFSENDPDGECRVYGVANYYAVVAGVAEKEKYGEVLEAAERLKSDMGYRLFQPCLGAKPIAKVGRVASGDIPPYLTENGNVYNHGSQGFFARALSVMEEGDKLFEMLKWLLPYDTSKHLTEKTCTPPYAIVNCWQGLPGFVHRSMMCFLTGSVAMGVRGVYEWMFGIQPCLDGLEINPCLPNGMKDAEVSFEFLGKKHHLKLTAGKAVLDGKELKNKKRNLIMDKEVWFVDSESL